MELQTKWAKDLLYPNKRYQKFMQKYCNYFDSIFEEKTSQFHHMRLLKDGRFMVVSSMPQSLELFLELEGYKDSPFFVKYEKTQTGCSFAWPDYDKENINHNSFQHAIEKFFGVYSTFSIQNKFSDYYELFLFDFQEKLKRKPLSEK